MNQLRDEARLLSAGQVLRAHRRPGEDPRSSWEATSEDLLTHVSCTTIGAGCWLPVPDDWELPMRVPVNYTAMLCVGGRADYTIGDHTYPLRSGGVLLCPPNVARSGQRHPGAPFELYSVHFQVRLHEVLDMAAIYPMPVVASPAVQTHECMVNAAQRIITELGHSKPGYVLAADAICTELFALIWREAGNSRARPGTQTANVLRLTPVFRLIEDRYSEPLTLRQLADAVRLGPTYFSAFFKGVVGMSPMRYLARFRLNRARELLATTDLPLSAVAQRTGYTDAAYLSRVFRAAERLTPGEYRRAQQSAMEP